MKLRIFLFLLLCAVCASGVRAQYSAVTLSCNASAVDSASSEVCNMNTAPGHVVVVNFSRANYTSASISDDHSNTWRLAAHCGSPLQGYAWYSTITSGTTINITVAIVGTSNAGYNLFSYEIPGGSPASDAKDQARCDPFTSNSPTQTSGSLTLLAHDAVIASAVCASGNTGTAEFAPVSPLVSVSGENGGATNSFRGAHIVDNSTSGSQTVAFTSAQGCGFGTFNGVFMFIAMSSSGGAAATQIGGFIVGPMKYPLGAGTRARKIPRDHPRKLAELERVQKI